VVRGNVTDVQAISSISRGHDAVINTVTPISVGQSLDSLDGQFFVKTTDALLQGLTDAGVPRLLLIGLFANLKDDRGRLLMDDPSAFPTELRPFALAHAAGLTRIRAADTTIDWLMLTPPALLQPEGPRTGRYRLGGETLPQPQHAETSHLSYADLAVAVIDEIESPRHHRTRVSIFD
jgi:hypothetical protein